MAPSSNPYDVIVVGARCAGSPTAMLLARKGYRVLLVDRVRFPSDTMRNHFIHGPGIASLKRWGLLDRLVATGCPPVRRMTFDCGDFPLTFPVEPVDGASSSTSSWRGPRSKPERSYAKGFRSRTSSSRTIGWLGSADGRTAAA
jgi:2-polyprenyl-6-methoxyphenol hydroxylase-like FAD-dependent oxidoreductase